mmetsp:Transcript_26522/g.56841  ORF Transcript_26522/g.56841 Transcript_26522/m.56841 type:complete len:256 (+) Transcript_26522:315-1082(+)|eukprot:CAMPEP_0201124270 /NCGR_PEP_ID=MMETSP0850-20130426/10652_1 /ASSEMBLY_ACC=CAM_ASM_000622 /TAXON_ID=183588 /ORGANISM="Pseudo-nitzschia fraudulenta, Strain WWA7" /LENGTH=255 /DNA_ID=CAMNT_0047391481 /DNA_START=249 /DNA_END=1016 /DNA_ORIENTATION=+
MRLPTLFLLLSATLALSASAFQQQRQPGSHAFLSRFAGRSSSAASSSSDPLVPAPSSPLLSAHFASGSEEGSDAVVSSSFPTMLRSRLRKATGFSFTVFRATLRGITGVSLTALYAGALAATGLWIRKTMSVLLSVFPSGFRYFLQPFLVLYYTPLILLRSLASPTTRKRAFKKHETVREAWKDAITVAEKTERDGYWPVVVDDDGYFELSKPPSVDGVLQSKDATMAEAMAASVEQAMEVNSDDSADDGDDERK